MIAKLRGRVDAIGDDHVVIDVGGVGYLVQCGSKTLSRLPAVGESVVLEIETKVSEDAIRLFGFLTSSERGWFRLLQDVQGVGARVALNILSVLEPDALYQAIAAGDKTSVSRAQGVGPKLAQRIVLELKDKMPTGVTVAALAPVVAAAVMAAGPRGAGAEALSALVNLGYRPAEAERAVGQVLARTADAPAVGELIRLSLRELAK